MGRPSAVITVRCDTTLHRRLRNESWKRNKSINQICVERLTNTFKTDLEEYLTQLRIKLNTLYEHDNTQYVLGVNRTLNELQVWIGEYEKQKIKTDAPQTEEADSPS